MYEKINPEECEYLREGTLPALVLAVEGKYNFTDEMEFNPIAHQTGGTACHQHYMYGKILTPRPEFADKIQTINDTFLDSDIFSPATLDEVITYRDLIKELLGVDCDISYTGFEEGIYPIDCSVENLRKLSTDEIPDNLDDLIKLKDGMKGALGVWGRWHLYILGENSD